MVHIDYPSSRARLFMAINHLWFIFSTLIGPRCYYYTYKVVYTVNKVADGKHHFPVVPHTRKLSREKTFTNFVAICESFLRENGGHGVL